MSVNGGSSVTTTISAKLVSGSTQLVSFSVSGLPSGATGAFSSATCTLACSTILTISTSGSTPEGNYPITLTSEGGGLKRSTVLNLSVLLALTVTTPTITQASYYVGKNGRDTHSCTQARSSTTPKLTIAAAIACVGSSGGAGANQTVEVLAGMYQESLSYSSDYTPFPSGTSWNAPFTLRGHAGDTVTIKASSGVNLQIGSKYPQYAIIQGFVFDGSNVDAQIALGNCCMGVSYLRFQNNSLINNKTCGFLGGGQYNEIVNNKIHGGGFNAVYTAGGAYCYPLYFSGTNSLIEGNEIYDFPSWGLHGYPGLQNNIIRNNIIHDFGWGDDRSSGILIYQGAGNSIYNNTIYNGTSAIGIGSATSNTVYNNTIYNMKK